MRSSNVDAVAKVVASLAQPSQRGAGTALYSGYRVERRTDRASWANNGEAGVSPAQWRYAALPHWWRSGLTQMEVWRSRDDAV